MAGSSAGHVAEKATLSNRCRDGRLPNPIGVAESGIGRPDSLRSTGRSKQGRFYGLVLSALVSKDIKTGSPYNAKQLFVKIHNNRAGVGESGCAAIAYIKGWLTEAQGMKKRRQW